MRALLLPVKNLQLAKKRLTGRLSPEERFGLARAMLADTVRAVEGVRNADKIYVVTNYPEAISTARSRGWEVLEESEQLSESASVDFASRCCTERGVRTLLRIPLDLPLIQPGDIEELLMGEPSAPSLVIVPSRDGTGTNAIVRTPPDLFPSQFGEGSFAKHLALAGSTGAQISIRRNPRLEMDVDDAGDLCELLGHDLQGTETGRWLRESGVRDRFRPSAGTGERPAIQIAASGIR